MSTKVTLAEVKNANYNQLRAIAKSMNFNAGKNPKAEHLRQALELLLSAKETKAPKTSSSVCTVMLRTLNSGDKFRFKTSDQIHVLKSVEELENSIKVMTAKGRKWSDKLDAQVVKVD